MKKTVLAHSAVQTAVVPVTAIAHDIPHLREGAGFALREALRVRDVRRPGAALGEVLSAPVVHGFAHHDVILEAARQTLS